MVAGASARLGPLARLAAFLTGADPEILQRCPPRDHSSVTTIALLLLGIWLWQTIAFSLTAHMLLDAMGEVRPGLVAISALMAGMVMLIDSYSLIRASWYLKGLEELRRGGLEIPGYLAMRVRNGLQLCVRVLCAVVMSLAAAVGFNLFCTSPEIDRVLLLAVKTENAALLQRTTQAYDAETARETAEIERGRQALAKAQADASALRTDVLRVAPQDPDLTLALAAQRRLDLACAAAERRLRETATRDSAALQVAQQRAAQCRSQRQAAQAQVAQLRARGEAAAARHHSTVQGRLDETAASQRQLQVRLDEREQANAARVASREDNIRAAMQRDPGYHPPDRGLLARVKALVQLMADPWVFGMTVLLHLAFLGIELGAVLCKVLTFVPSFYAVILASEEHVHAAETATALWQRLGDDPPEDDATDPSDQPPVPEPAPMPVLEPAPRMRTPANDDVAAAPPIPTPAAAGTTADRFEESAELARAQAAARAAEQAKPAHAPPGPPETLAALVMDGPIRRGRGRPPGAKTRPRPANDDPAVKNDPDAA